MSKKTLPRACAATLLACGLKRCSLCMEIKPISEYQKRSASADGLQYRCKPCQNGLVADWFKENPDYLREYYQTDRGKEVARQAWRKRRALKAKVRECFTAADERYVFMRDGYKCRKCGMTNAEHKEKWGQRLHIDHIKPLSKGHALTRFNAQLLCRSCNSSKGNKMGD